MVDSRRPLPRCRICDRQIPAEALDFSFRFDRDDSVVWLCPECTILMEPLIRDDRVLAPSSH